MLLGVVFSISLRIFTSLFIGILVCSFLLFLKILFIYYYREGKGGRKRGRETSRCERYIDWLPLMCPPIRDLARNPGMCPDWELNQ